jgi:hypothetical protein
MVRLGDDVRGFAPRGRERGGNRSRGRGGRDGQDDSEGKGASQKNLGKSPATEGSGTSPDMPPMIQDKRLALS